jgi:miniconductance mechanosensitive channel
MLNSLVIVPNPFIETSDTRTELQANIIDMLANIGLSISPESWQFTLLAFVSLFVIAVLSHLVARFVLYFKLIRLVGNTKNTWDDELVAHGVFRRIAHLIPGIVLYSGKFIFLDPQADYFAVVALIVSFYLIITVYRVLSASLSAGEAIYRQSPLAQKAPITGFVQVARLIITLALIFLSISLLLGKSPVYLLSGLTAIAAVLLLIFRDTILGFVAGIQIAANRMFNTGDWIEIPKFGVDGDITEIGLTVVKVQNWDKTISTIPTHALTTESVKNWRGMEQSGGRRIKRAIHLDMRSIQFANNNMLQEWRKLSLLKDYLAKKENELEEDAKRCKSESLDLVNSRKLTNLGTFRAYIKAYLYNHPDIHRDMTFLVRQLKPTEVGIPIEVYCFSKKQAWADYEHLQSEIFDHLLAILPLFRLTAYQRVANDNKQLLMLDEE